MNRACVVGLMRTNKTTNMKTLNVKSLDRIFIAMLACDLAAIILTAAWIYFRAHF